MKKLFPLFLLMFLTLNVVSQLNKSTDNMVMIETFDDSLLGKKMIKSTTIIYREYDLHSNMITNPFPSNMIINPFPSKTYEIHFEGSNKYISFENLKALKPYFFQYKSSSKEFKTYRNSVIGSKISMGSLLTSVIVLVASGDNTKLTILGAGMAGAGLVGVCVTIPLYRRGLDRSINAYNKELK